MNALPLMLGTLCVLAVAYRYYSAFIAAKVLTLDDRRPTPAHVTPDGHNYVATNRWVLFGHHFAAITGAGPLVGPVLALQFGFLPGFVWLLAGVVIGGAVHDFVILTASMRHGGRSLAEIARRELGPFAAMLTAVTILFVVVIALAGLGLVVVNALRESAWGVFTISLTIPIALGMGLYMHTFRPGRVGEATVIGVVLLMAAVVAGGAVPGSWLGPLLSLDAGTLLIAIAAYGFIASVLPVWMLLCPRDYLSAFMKVSTIALLVVGVLIVNPELHMPPVTPFVDGGGPIVGGTLFPFLFVTIACGAISGFHALVGSGTTPKMIDRESDARMIGYGAMLIESLVGITCLIAAAALFPSDYFHMNVPAPRLSELPPELQHPVELPALSAAIGEELEGRTGGAVTLAVGMAQIFSGIPGLQALLSYWYHFAIMFEALFILTTIDTGTRVARFLVQEFLGRFHPRFARTEWMPGTILSTALVVSAWAYFIHTGSISTIWPMFGTANQLLAVLALAVGTTVLLRWGRRRYIWVTLVPLAFVATTTLAAGWQGITQIFLPLARTNPVQGYLDATLTVLIMIGTVVVIIDSARRWIGAVRDEGREDVPGAPAEDVSLHGS
jgi:carbon starvation protein